MQKKRSKTIGRPRGPRVQCVCRQCGRGFETVPSKAAGKRGRFCSMECLHAGNLRPVEERFWSFVDKDGPVVRPELGPCWLWTGALSNKGYGKFPVRLAPKVVRLYVASRFVMELGGSPIPDDLDACHKCDNRACVRPDHIFPGTTADNLADMAAKGRSTRGERNALAKLTDNSVRAIRTASAAGARVRHLARQYGVSEAAISLAVKRRTWQHVP